jgi:hypothetical protein
MRARLSYLFFLFDYVLGAFFAMSALVIGILFFALTGAPKSYEMQALGGAYTDVLAGIEASARTLREDYCARAQAEAAAQAQCGAAPASQAAHQTLAHAAG